MSGQYDAVHDFVVQLESKAKRILTAANKQKEEEARREHLEKMFGPAGSKKKKNKGGMSTKGSLTVDVARADKTLTGATQGMGLTNSAMKTTKKLEYSVPKLYVSMDATKDMQPEASAPPRPPSATMLSPIKKKGKAGSKVSKIMTLGAMDTTKTLGLTMDANVMSQTLGTLDQGTTVMRRNNTLQKLNQSAYMSNAGTGPSTIDVILSERKKKLMKVKKAQEKKMMETETSVYDLKRQANDALTGKLKTTARKKKSARSMDETQGPVDWSVRGLRSKYRGENEREELWENWMAANAISMKAF